jgi:hypothetical protein
VDNFQNINLLLIIWRNIEFSSFFEGRFSPVINPFVLLEKMRGCV